MNKTSKKPRKGLTQMQRTMIAMEKAGAVRRDGKVTAIELGVSSPEKFVARQVRSDLAESLDRSFPTMIKQLDYTPEGDRCVTCNSDAYTCEHYEDAKHEARLDAQAEYEDQQRAWRDA